MPELHFSSNTCTIVKMPNNRVSPVVVSRNVLSQFRQTCSLSERRRVSPKSPNKTRYSLTILWRKRKGHESGEYGIYSSRRCSYVPIPMIDLRHLLFWIHCLFCALIQTPLSRDDIGVRPPAISISRRQVVNERANASERDL